MTGYDAATYGERIADVYDSLHAGVEEAMIDRLAEWAAGGPALELGIGTGRIALPLAARGIEVRGIDASPAMVEKLRGKPGGAGIPVEYGDFADVDVPGEFRLVYVVFNTFFGLLSQEDQVRCFRNVSARLEPDGIFVLEAFVPDLGRFDRGQRVNTNRVEEDRVILDVSRHDPVRQRVDSQHVCVTEAGIRLYPVRIRYAYPSELDLMARLAGLRLRHRWGRWRGESFTAASQVHVSVYERQDRAHPG